MWTVELAGQKPRLYQSPAVRPRALGLTLRTAVSSPKGTGTTRLTLQDQYEYSCLQRNSIDAQINVRPPFSFSATCFYVSENFTISSQIRTNAAIEIIKHHYAINQSSRRPRI